MAHTYGKPSRFLWFNYKLSKIIATIYLLILGAVLYFLFIEHFNYLRSIVGLITVLIVGIPLILVNLFFYNKFNREANDYYHGRKGEGAIWYELMELTKDYYVFQDLIIDGRGNIDFVVLGPTGLFTIEVKSHLGDVGYKNGELTLNNQSTEKDFLNQAMAEALNTHDYLKQKLNEDIFVNPVIVFSNPQAHIHFMLEPVRNVFVVQKRFLRKFILSRPRILSFDRITLIENELKNLVN